MPIAAASTPPPASRCGRPGDPIAEVGHTGNATGPHLHFELMKDGVYVNPIYYYAAP